MKNVFAVKRSWQQNTKDSIHCKHKAFCLLRQFIRWNSKAFNLYGFTLISRSFYSSSIIKSPHHFYKWYLNHLSMREMRCFTNEFLKKGNIFFNNITIHENIILCYGIHIKKLLFKTNCCLKPTLSMKMAVHDIISELRFCIIFLINVFNKGKGRHDKLTRKCNLLWIYNILNSWHAPP